MAARKTHDLVVTTGEYQSQGQTKKRYQTVGALMEGDNGPFIMLEKWFNPAGVQDASGRSTLLISCFEPRQGNTDNRPASGTGANKPAPSAASDDDWGDVPF